MLVLVVFAVFRLELWWSSLLSEDDFLLWQKLWSLSHGCLNPFKSLVIFSAWASVVIWHEAALNFGIASRTSGSPLLGLSESLRPLSLPLTSTSSFRRCSISFETTSTVLVPRILFGLPVVAIFSRLWCYLPQFSRLAFFITLSRAKVPQQSSKFSDNNINFTSWPSR